MALVNKAGSLIRQTASKHINHELSASNSSIFQIIRCMSSSKLLVAGLSHATTNTSLKKAFVPYGDVKEAQVFLKSEKASKRSGSSGFGLVVYSNTESASAAIKALDQKELHGRVVRVKYLENKAQEGLRSGVGYGSSFLEGYTWAILDQIGSSKIQDSDVAGPNVGGSDKCNCGDKGGGESHNSGVTSGNRNANEDYGDLRSGYFDGESHNSDSARGNRNAREDYGDHSSGYIDKIDQTSSDPVDGNNNNFFHGWGGDGAGGSNDGFFSGWGDGDNSKGFFSDFFNDDD